MTWLHVLLTGDPGNQPTISPVHVGQLPGRPYQEAGEHSGTVTGTCPHYSPGDLTRAQARRPAPDKSRPVNGPLPDPHPQRATACAGMPLRPEITTQYVPEETIMTAESADQGQGRQPWPVTYNAVSQRYGPGTHHAQERYHELATRDCMYRAYTKLRATGRYDPARHGTGDTEPLTAAEHLELLATAEYLSRSYKPAPEVDHALRAGASWAQVADALGTDEPAARSAYRAWADGQHDLLAWTEGRLGMSDAEDAEAMRRASHGAELEAEG